MDWARANFKKISKNPLNRELITGRVVLKNKKTHLTLSLGLDICDMLNFKKDDYVNVFFHKREKNLLLLKKSPSNVEGYKLRLSSPNSNFLDFSILFLSQCDFKLSQTTCLDYDFDEQRKLLINIVKLKWS